ncbi:hypothetical protein VCUG_01909 [Vavraia culicis subsp. floridensis]|uniref:V-SNARE coiled-coil homology domain-containing protein n=1 Tax=Vavraia culicis (isolate floridensis) TaxID=948595 RepID=L2GSH3_VAVCU|nr:uncharacterized protein VCUG_01909 [Vavraia culicis subsp. floridensis]ELA46579.1 hypothetical protein VCUG_01909 [Vavraia culicis subsp. floridensis]
MLISLSSVETDTLKIHNEAFNLRQFNFLQRIKIKDYMRTIFLKIAQNVQTHDLQEITQELNGKMYKFYVKVYTGIVYIACIQDYYPLDLIDTVLDKCAHVHAEGDGDMNGLLEEYKDYKMHDTTEKIAKELEDTKVILTRTLESVVLRGEKLGELTDSAKKLELKSKKLFEKAKAQNKCCSFF